MKIEIVTTKKKLSKALIGQMRQVTIAAMQNGKCLGYVVNAIKDSYNTAIIAYNHDYYILSLSWEKGDKSVHRWLPKYYTQNKKFESEELCQNWWEAYVKMEKLALTNHIYI